MTPTELVMRLQELGVDAWVEAGRLCYEPEELVSDELRAQLRAAEPGVVAFLNELLGEDEPAVAPLAPVPAGTRLPLSFAQERLWFLAELETDGAALNKTLALRLRGPLEVAAVEWAIEQVLQRHNVLRTRFSMVDGEPTQVADAALPPLAVEDLAREAEPESAAMQRFEELGAIPIDLAEGPVARAHLLRIGADDHVLVVVVHHVAIDRVSWSILVTELSQLYEARRGGAEASPLPALAVQYGDYAHWQRSRYGTERDRLLEFWRKTLDALPTLELPTDRPRPEVQQFRGGRATHSLSRSASDGLRALGRGEGCTWFMTVLAAFDVLLARTSSQDEVVVGVPVSNRETVELEALVGLFVNTVVVRVGLGGAVSFREVLRRVRDATVAALEHGAQPFEQLVLELRPERDLGRNPLFQVMCNVLADAEPLQFAGVEVEPLQPQQVATRLDLELTVLGDADVELVLEYDASLFEAGTAARMLRRLQLLVDAVVADPDADIWALPVLLPEEHQRLLVELNRSQRDYPRDLRVPQLFERTVREHGERIAVQCGDEALTYRELNERANRIAHVLRARGAGPDVRVGIEVPRSVDMVVALFGVLKSGAVYVPIDPGYPVARVQTMLADAEVELLVTTAERYAERGDIVSAPLLLDSDRELLAEASIADPEPVGGPLDLAYLLYTSGSTGVPKGVEIPQRALVNLVCSIAGQPGLGPDDAMLALASIAFDISALELFTPMVVGARIVVVPQEDVRDGLALADIVDRHGVTRMQATPATWRLLLESGWRGNDRVVALSGGELLPRELAERMLERCAGVWCLYGPTETTIYSTGAAVQSDPDSPMAGVPVGPPLANTDLYLLDRNLQPVPFGVPGEIYIGGDGLARGYRNRPELTAEKFISHPFSSDAGARVYASGDLARYHPDGALEFIRRKDNQIKLRGYRIELGEVEAATVALQPVRACAVLLDASGERAELIAYVVFEAGASMTASELRTALRERLPRYMVPATFITLGALPLTANGKLDRKRLLAMRGERVAASSGPPVAPRNDVERTVASVWCDVLGCEGVSVHDNFFDLGGHSLLAMRVVHRLDQELGKRLSPTDLFVQTLEEVARSLSSGGAVEPQSSGGVGETRSIDAGRKSGDSLLKRVFRRRS